MTLPDAIRWVDAGLALIMCLSCPPCMVFSADHWQRLRFVVMLGYGVVTVSGQIDALGKVATWRTYLLLPITILAVVSTVQFALRALQRARGVDGARR